MQRRLVCICHFSIGLIILKNVYSKRFYIFTLDKIPWRRYKRIEFFIKFPKIHDAMLILAEYFRRAFALCTCNIS